MAPIHSFIPSFQHNTKTFSNKTRRLSSLPIFPLFPVPIPILSINNINNTSSCLLIYFSLFPSCFTFQHLIRDDPLSLQIFFQGKVWMVREFLDYHIGNPPPCLFFFSGVIELLVFSFFLIGLFWNLFFLGSFGLSLTLIFIFIFLLILWCCVFDVEWGKGSKHNLLLKLNKQLLVNCHQLMSPSDGKSNR